MKRVAGVDIESGRTDFLVMSVRSIWLLAVALITLLPVGCGDDPGDDDTPIALRVGLIPDRPVDAIERVFRPLLDYIAAETGFAIELVLPATYEETLELLGNGDLDMVRLGGFSYVVARQKFGAEALVTRDVDLMFRSVIIAHQDLGADDLLSLRGRSLQFGAGYSTSGHVMPRIFMEGAGIVPEEFFSTVKYGRNHIDTVQAVLAREIDAGAVNSVILERALRDDEEMKNALRIVWTSPRYANYVWATRAGMEITKSHAIRGAFLSLSRLNETDKVILDRVGAAGYLPAQQKNYDMLTAYVEALELDAQ
ncbi:MAG: phosphate/phosphite/phosphonate ABC transporter substrate-binding protein [Gammaproteobacteria bacterium]